MSQFLGMNKDRLYLAFYKRGQVKPDDAKYHTALLLVPKTVNDGTVVQRYHVKNEIIDGKIQWVFPDSEEAKPRTLRLVSVLYLGKVASKKKVFQDALNTVPIVQDDPAWRCHHWVWSAVQLLADQNIVNLALEAQAKNPQQIWDTGMAFTDDVVSKNLNPYQTDLPACDANGEWIDCNIGHYKD